MDDKRARQLKDFLKPCVICKSNPKNCNCMVCKNCIKTIIRMHAKIPKLDIDYEVMALNHDVIEKELKEMGVKV